jgi:ATP-dependent helicase/nuclease subunit B
MSDYVRWLSGLIGPDVEQDPEDPALAYAAYHLNIPAQLALAGGVEIANRDRSALAEFVGILRSLIRADSLLTALDAVPISSAEHFLRQLRIAVDKAQIQHSPSRAGRVLVTTVANARGLPHRHVFILGLSEGIFPAPQPEDPLYLDSERAALSAAGIPLARLADRANDEGLFYEMIGLAHETLTLSRPTEQDGAPWVASHLWRAALAVLSDAEALRQTTRSGDIARLDEAASMQEYMLALADGLSRHDAASEVAAARAWLLRSQGELWQQIEQAR